MTLNSHSHLFSDVYRLHIVTAHTTEVPCDGAICRARKLFPKRQILDSSKLKEFTDDNFDFDENGRRFSKLVENTVEKGEIARNEQFLLFLRCFQKACTADK